jgi:hypothetical protein
MPAILRYHTVNAVARVCSVYSFATETALHHYAQQHLPADAREIDMWWQDDAPRQKPTHAIDADAVTNQQAWLDAGGKPVSLTTPLEIVAAPRAPRRADCNTDIRSPRIAHLSTGYETNNKAKDAAA